jgi:phosphate starvation-inducible protein PhoH and related proteins
MSRKKKSTNNGNGHNGNGHKVIVNKSKSNRIVITAKTANQKLLLKSIKENIITIVYGCCGTGKTRLSVLNGLRDFRAGKFEKIIFTRPCIAANGENLGYLPGDLNEKIHPYLYPIFNFLSEYLDDNAVDNLIKDGKIITLPLAFQRGVTFENAYVVLDEAQNSRPEQVRMFLTRIGHNCKVVITGDPEQTDISGINGITDAVERLKGVKNLGIVKFGKEDIIRHPIVAEIEEKYLDK